MKNLIKKVAVVGAVLAVPVLMMTAGGSPAPAKADKEADYVFNAPIFQSGIWYGTRGTNDVHGDVNLWEINLSDREESDQPGGTYYQIQFFGPAPENLDTIRPVDGTYTVTAELTRENMTINPYSNFKKLDGNGRIDVEADFKSGTMTISTEERRGEKYMNYVADLTDTHGETHHVTYSTRFITFSDESQGPGDLEKDLDFTAPFAKATFREIEGDVMQVQLMFSSQTYANGEALRDGKPYSEVYVESYMPFDINGLSNGVYNVTTGYGASFTLQDGDIIEQFGVRYPVGTYIQYVGPGQDVHWGAVKEGTMTVSGEGDSRTVACDFKTLEGFSIKAVYTGALDVAKLPSSMLTEDRVLDLTDAEVVATGRGDANHENRHEWFITFMPTGDHKDGFQTYISSKARWFYQGITTDVYTPCPTKSLWSAEYLRGYMTDHLLAGTWYLSDFDEDNVPHLYAPAQDGDLHITNHGDGSYTFKFKFNDGLNHYWSGEWTGKPTMVCQDPQGPGSGIDELINDLPGFNVDGRHISFGENAAVKVWDTQGRLFLDAVASDAELPAAGVWIVSINGKVLKLSVK